MNMKKVISALLAGLLGGGVAFGAQAADVYSGQHSPDTYEAPFSAPVSRSWTGFYIGARIGGGKDHHDLKVDEFGGSEEASCQGGELNEAGSACKPVEFIEGQDAVEGVEAVEAVEAVEGKEAVPAHCENPSHTLYTGNLGGEPGCYKGFHKKADIVPEQPAVEAVEGVEGVEAVEAQDAVPPSCTNGGSLNEEGNACLAANFIPGIQSFATKVFEETLTDSDVFYGGMVGADWQQGRVVFGVFGYYDMGNTSTDLTSLGLGEGSLDNDGEWAVGGRVGFLVNQRLLAYVSAAYKQVDMSAVGVGFKDATFDGAEVGGGVEFLAVDNFSIGVEYTHFFGSTESIFSDCASTGCVDGNLEASDQLDQDKIMLIGRIRFN
jgi:opacity protein-like surface antigen